MTKAEKQILINQTAMMNALTGMFTLYQTTFDPNLKKEKREELTKAVQSTVTTLGRAVLVTTALMKEDAKAAEGQTK